MARTIDSSELLDVDVHELAWSASFVTDGGPEPDPAQPTKSLTAEDSGDRRERHRQRLRDLCGRHPQPAQLDDHRHPLRAGAIGDPMRRRRAINEASFAGRSIPANPLARAPFAHTGRPSSCRDRPAIAHDPLGEQPPAIPTESRVTVKLHPVSSLD